MENKVDSYLILKPGELVSKKMCAFCGKEEDIMLVTPCCGMREESNKNYPKKESNEEML